MQYIERKINLDHLVADKSCFLFGPRQTGKSSYLANQLKEKPCLVINLLDRSQYLKFQLNPGLLNETVRAQKIENRIVVIDEIQKLPELLDSVHLLIEERKIRFILTGSSARKLKRIGANLLGGRARTRNLHGFLACELGIFSPKHSDNLAFSLATAMHKGTIPNHYFSNLIDEDLSAYVGRYLLEEISAEGLSRNIPAFSRFLEVAALCSSEILNYTSIASDVGLSRQTVVNYFEILTDTHIGFLLPAFRKTRKRKAVAAPKFYLFDMGVTRYLKRISFIDENSADFGAFFEQFIFLELLSFRDYEKPLADLSYWRSERGYEVDFIFDNKFAIEVKASRNVTKHDITGLLALEEEGIPLRKFVVCRETSRRTLANGVEIFPWQEFLEMLWNNGLFDSHA